MENSEIIRYATENHTDELIRKIIDTYHDHSTNDNIKEKEDKIIAMCTAVAIRSINKTTINYGGTPPDNQNLTAIIIRRIEMTYYNNSLDENKKRKKYRILCLEVAFQNNMGKFVESFRNKEDKNAK